MNHSLLSPKLIKSLRFYVFAFGITFLMQFQAAGQTPIQDKVERYLYTCYDANKSGLKENDRVLSLLEKHLNDFIFAMDKTKAAEMKTHEKEFNEFLANADKVKDEKMMQQMVEDSKRSYKILLTNILERGIQSVDEARECRKAIVYKMMEMDLLKMKQEKLLTLLKDEASRGKFINTLVLSSNINEQTDLRQLMVAVDKSISDFDI